MRRLLWVSDTIDRLLLSLATVASWLFLFLAVAIVLDVTTRKLGFRIPMMTSTRFQELEWHIHTFLFSVWFGATYVKDKHVRVDLLSQGFSQKGRAWAELFGILVLAIPFCLVGLYFSIDYAFIAWMTNEGSELGQGLPARWVPKAIIATGIFLFLLACLSVGLRSVAVLAIGERANGADHNEVSS